VSADRIALFVPSLGLAGAERVAVNLGRGLVKAGRLVDFVAGKGRGPLVADLPAGARLVDLEVSRVLAGLPGLVRYVRRERPAGIISFMDHANIVALWARVLARRSTRVVATVHNTISIATERPNNRRAKVLPFFMRAFYPWADAIVAVSQGVADDLVRTTGLPADSVEVIYNPVITSSLLAARASPSPHPWLEPGQPPVILGVGRLTAQKDFPNLIHAFAQVRGRRQARLIILGEGDERRALEELVSRLGLQHDVALPGFHLGVYAFMARAAVFALSSAWEGLPTVLIEALALSRAVVSTDCPSGPREILQHGRLGRLVPVHDPEALGRAILASLDEPGPPVPDAALEPFTEQAAVKHYLRAVGLAESVDGLASTPRLPLRETLRSNAHEGI
jgi:glycosyltransferase involved in cell wall biosynthesis